MVVESCRPSRELPTCGRSATVPYVTQRQRRDPSTCNLRIVSDRFPLPSIVRAGRIWRPRNVFQYLPRHAWQLGDVPRWRISQRLRAAIPCLDRRARHRAVRAKHATVARLRLKPLVAPFAVIEKLASVRRHRFDSLMPTLGTGDGRFQLHHRTFLDRPRRREAAVSHPDAIFQLARSSCPKAPLCKRRSRCSGRPVRLSLVRRSRSLPHAPTRFPP
jgi:hypothetical protein